MSLPASRRRGIHLSLLLHFTRQSLVDRYAGSVLGALWAFIMPLVMILIFVFVFSKIMGGRLGEVSPALGEYGYSIYLVSGILGWNAFSNTVTRMSSVYLERAAVIARVDLPLVQLPLFIPLTEVLIFAVSFSFFIGFLLLLGHGPGPEYIWLPLILAVQMLLAWSLGFICAVLSVLLRDVRELVAVAMQLWFWLTPLVYVMGILPQWLQSLMLLNPMVPIVNSWRDVVLYQQAPSLVGLGAVALLAMLLLGLGLLLFRRVEAELRDLL
ncbi:MAG: ABC transporter permease [Marinobacterium sp.]|nr:ABC transporter permease [Marinobacterium sp.]